MCTSLLLFSTSTQGELQMRMLLIVFRDSLEDEIVVLLKEFNVKAFTELHKVGGTGETGDAFHSFASPGGRSPTRPWWWTSSPRSTCRWWRWPPSIRAWAPRRSRGLSR